MCIKCSYVEIVGPEYEREKKPELKATLNSIWQQQVQGKLSLPHTTEVSSVECQVRAKK